MSRWGIAKSLGRIVGKRGKSSDGGGLTEPSVARLAKELAEESGRVPPEARADLAVTQVYLTRRSVPDEDPERTLLAWLAERGFHDVLALRSDDGFEPTTRKREGLDLCLWVDPERLLRAAINKDPTNASKISTDLSSEERTSLVQAATSVLAEAKENNMLSYHELFLLHEPTTLGRLRKLHGSYRLFWDRGDVLLDAIAAYFGTKIGFYFAWLKFYTAALVYPTLMGLLVWWTERVNRQARDHPTGIMQSCALGGACGVAGVSWWEWLIGAAASLVGGFFQYFGVEHQGVGQGVDQGIGRGVDQGGGQGGQGFEGFGDAMAGVVGGSDHGGGVGGVGMCACSSFGNSRCGSPTSLKPLFNVFLAVWATLFLVLWKRRSYTLAFRWGVHKEDTIERAKFMAGWKRNGRAGLTHAGPGGRRSVSSASSSFGTTAELSGSSAATTNGSTKGGGDANGKGSCRILGGKVLRRQCATGKFRASAAAAAAAVIEGADGIGAAVRQDGLQGEAWEPFRTARLFASWSLEAVLLYLAIRMMLWFAWLEIRSIQKFGGGINVQLVRVASIILPMTFYGVHRKWAQALTQWEGHVTQAGAENSMTVKRFTFRCVNSFSRVCYLGFWQRDLVGLQDMLTTVLVARSFMDALKEVVAPMIQLYFRRRAVRAKAKKAAVAACGGVFMSHRPPPPPQLTRGSASQRQGRHKHQQTSGVANMQEVAFRAVESVSSCQMKKQLWRDALTNESMMPEYQTHGGYLDLMVQYGYVTMFAMVLPLAPLLALIRCLAEIFIDHHKLLRCRRPPYIDRSSIGAWYGVLEFVGMASVLTNCLLLALSAEELRLYIPVPLAKQFPQSKYLVMAVFAEHIILGVKAALRVLIDEMPDGVEKAMAEELLHVHEESRRRAEGIFRLGEDVKPTHVTIVRQHRQQPTSDATDSSSHLMRDSSRHSSISASSIHMLSPSLPEAKNAQRTQQQQQQLQQQQQQQQQGVTAERIPPASLAIPRGKKTSSLNGNAIANGTTTTTNHNNNALPPRPSAVSPAKAMPKSRRIWSKRSSQRHVTPLPAGEYTEAVHDGDSSSAYGGEYGRSGGSSLGAASESRRHETLRSVPSSSVAGGAAAGGAQSAAAMRSVFSESGTGPRRRISFG